MFTNFSSFSISQSAIIHDLIKAEELDILALCKTWICGDTLDCIKRDNASKNLSLHKVHRRGTSGRSTRGGGLAVLFKSSLDIKIHPQAKTLIILV